MCKNHPFVDGNKRTAVTAAGLFYMLNGWWLRASQDELVQLALDVARDVLHDIESIAERLREFAIDVPMSDD